MTIRELLEADSCVVALEITIRKDKRFVKDYLIGAHITNGSYYEEIGRNEKWTQYNRGYGSCEFRRAISFRPINYQDVEGGSSCGCILKNIPKRILDLPIDSLKPSRVMYSSQAYHNWSEFHGYFIDSPIEGDWKDLPEEKITQDSEEDPEEEYLTDEDLLKPKEENISFDDLLGGEITDKEALKFLKESRMNIILPRMSGKSILIANIVEATARAIQALEEKVNAQEAAASEEIHE